MTTEMYAYGGRSDEMMFAKFIDVIQTFLTEPAILIGLLVGIGYALDQIANKNYYRHGQRHGGINDGVIWWFPVTSATFKPVAEAIIKPMVFTDI